VRIPGAGGHAATLREQALIRRQRKKTEPGAAEDGYEKIRPPGGEARMYVHVLVPTFWDTIEHLGELQWVRAVVELDGG